MRESGLILDANGLPMKAVAKSLTNEEAQPSAVGNRTSTFDPVISGMTPSKLAGILKDAVKSDPADFFAMAEEMEERDLHYHSVLGTRKRAISKLPISIEAVDESAEEVKIADLVRDAVSRPDFGDMIEDMLDAFGKGVSVVEQIWDISESQWLPRAWKWRDPRFFDFDEETRSQLLLKDGEARRQLTPGKYIVHTAKVKSGLPIRGGLARLCAWCFIMKSYTLKDWMAFSEIFGMPLRVGRYDRSASEDDKRRLLQAVMSIAADAGAIIPKGMDIEFITAASGRGEAVFGSLADYLDKQVSKAILGQTMTADDGASMSQAKVHDDVRDDIRDADKRRVEATLQRDVVNQIVTLNFGIRKRYPKITLLVAEPEDIEAISNALGTLVPLGLKVRQDEVREKLGMQEPGEKDDILQPAAAGMTGLDFQPPADKSKNRVKSQFRTTDPTDDLDQIADEELENWEEHLGPILQPIIDAADETEDYESFLDKIDALFEDAEDQGLIRSLARAMAKAKINGLTDG